MAHRRKAPSRALERASTTTTALGARPVGTGFNRIIWPDAGAGDGLPLVWDPWSALQIPAVSRAVQIYTGSLKQAPMDVFRGDEPLPRPRVVDQPDPNQSRPWFVQSQVDDYFLNGNAVAYTTAFDAAMEDATG